MIVTTFTIGMFVIGLSVARDPNWDVAMYCAAIGELDSRGYFDRKLSTSEDNLIGKIVGAEPSEPDPDVSERQMSATIVLTGASDVDLHKLYEIRSEALESALEKQLALVSNLTNLKLFYIAWSWRRNLSLFSVSLRSLTWFAPKFLSKFRAVGERYLTTSTLVGFVCGILYWGFTQMGNPDSRVDWLAVVGVVVTLACSVGLAATVTKQIGEIVVNWWGHPRTWNAKRVAVGTSTAITCFAFLILVWTGELQRYSAIAIRWILAWVDLNIDPKTIGASLILLLMGYGIWNCIQRVRATRIRTAERVNAAILAFIMLTLAFVAAVWLFRFPESLIPIATWSLLLTTLLLGAVTSIDYIAQFIRDYRYVLRESVVVPRKGFRVWILFTWVGCLAFVLTVPRFFIQQNGDGMVNAFALSVNLIAMVATLLVALTFLPGAIVTGLWARRIMEYADAHRKMVHAQTHNSLSDHFLNHRHAMSVYFASAQSPSAYGDRIPGFGSKEAHRRRAFLASPLQGAEDSQPCARD